MPKFLKEGERLTKQNFTSMALRFRPYTKKQVDPQGKSDYQVAKEKMEIAVDDRFYSQFFKKALATLSPQGRKQVLNVLSEGDRTTFIRRANGHIKTDIEHNINADEVKAYARKQINDAKTFEEKVETLRKYCPQYAADIDRDGNIARIELAFSNVSAEQFKAAYLNQIVNAETNEKAKEIAAPFAKNIDLNDSRYTAEDIITAKSMDGVAENVLNVMQENLTEENVKELEDYVNNYVPTHEQDWKEIGNHYLDQNTRLMKEKIQADNTISPQEKAEVMSIMDKINEDTVNTGTSHLDLVDGRRKNSEEALSRDAVKLGTQALIEEGIDPDAIENRENPRTNHLYYRGLKQGKQQDYQKMQETEMQFSDKTKNAIKQVFAKFDQYGYTVPGLGGEAGVKAYALSQYNDAKVEYAEALNNQNTKLAIEKAKEVNKHETQIRDILKTVNENFPVGEEDVYPGNVDVMRNGVMSVDFRKDVKGISQLNGLFALNNFIKYKGITVDEFLSSPKKYVSEVFTKDAFKVNDPVELIKGKSGADAIYSLTSSPKENLKYTGWGIPRMIENLACLESDPELKKNNQKAMVSFTNAVQAPYQEVINGDTRKRVANKNIVDRFLIVKEPQLDDKLLKGYYYDPQKAEYVDPKGFDEAEYVANSQESAQEFLERLKQNVITYTNKNYSKNPGDETLSNSEFVQAAQKAAAKYLMVKGVGDTLVKPVGQQTEEDAAKIELMSFINDGKIVVDDWINTYYENNPENGVIMTQKAQAITNSIVCTNPYENGVESCEEYVNARMRNKGNTREYANGENNAQTLNDKKAYLTNAYRNGEVPESFYKARMEQLNANNARGKMPPFFATDNLPKRDDYVKSVYGEENANELSGEEKDLIYNNYVNKCTQEKRTFITKQFLKEHNLVERGQFYTSEEMEKLYPAAKEEANKAKQAYEEQKQAEKQAADDRENALSHDERIKFVREGETVNKANFAKMSERFLNYAFRGESQMEGATDLKKAQDLLERSGDSTHGTAFINSVKSKLTPEQNEEIIKSMPEESKASVYNLIGRRLAQKTQDKYYAKKDEVDAMPAGSAKVRAEEELKTLKKVTDTLSRGLLVPEEAKRLATPYLTQQELNDPKLSLVANTNSDFYYKNAKAFTQKAANYLTEEQMREVVQDVQNHKVPWERTYQEMGKTVYDQQTAQVKTQIDGLNEIDGKPLSEERKAEIKANLDLANDFLRESQGEKADNYFPIATALQNACLHDGSKRGEEKMRSEGLDPDILEFKKSANSNVANVVLNEGKEEEKKKWDNAEFKYSPETKKAIKHVFNKMREFGYDKAGIVGEQGMSKEYGLGKLADTIRDYKDAMQEGDPVKISKAAENMVKEKANVDELLGYIKEHFPVDNKKDNFAMAGNIDVARNNLFPPHIRYDDAAVTQLNSLYHTLNFAVANGIDPDEFLENPVKYMKEVFQNKECKNLNETLKGKSGGAALFEACINPVHIPNLGYGSSRSFEAFHFYDMDPEIRAHNHGLDNYLEKTVMNNQMYEMQARDLAYKGNEHHLDRLLFVSEPLQDASILGVSLYDAKKLSYSEPQPFDEMQYLNNNGKSIGEMKEQLDNNIKEYLRLNAERRSGRYNDSIQGISEEKFLKIAQRAAKKILISRFKDRDEPEYRALEGILSNGKDYVNNLFKPEKDLVQNAQSKLAEAKNTLTLTDEMIDNRLNELANSGGKTEGDPVLATLVSAKEEYQRTIDEQQAIINEHSTVDKIKFDAEGDFTEHDSYQHFMTRTENFYDDAKRTLDLKPDKDFNDSMKTAQAELTSIDARIDARLNEIVNSGAQGNFNKDDQIQVLAQMKEAKLAEIEQKKQDYINKLGIDVLKGRIPESYKNERIRQVRNNEFDKLPEPFRNPNVMSKQEYINSLNGNPNYNLNDYDEADRDALYEAYVERENATYREEAEEFATKRYATEHGFTVIDNVGVMEGRQGDPVNVNEPEAKPLPEDYSGRLFAKGEQITKDNLLQKVTEAENSVNAEPNGKTWIENREKIERAENNKVRLAALFEEGCKSLPAQGKQAVFDSLDEDTKKSLENRAKEEYINKLRAKTGQAKTIGDTLNTAMATTSLEDIKTAASPFLTDAEKADPKLQPINRVQYGQHIAGKNQQAWGVLIQNLKEEDIRPLTLKADATDAIIEKDLSEVKIERYTDEINAVKNIAGNMKSLHGRDLTEEDKRQISQSLDTAKEHLVALTDDYRSALDSVRMGREEYSHGMNYTRSRYAVEDIQKQGIGVDLDARNCLTMSAFHKQQAGYNEILMGQELPVTLSILDEGQQDNFKKLQESEFQYKPETKQAIIDIFHKMDEYGYGDLPFAGEEGDKIYGLRKYDNARKKFEAQIKSKDPVEQIKAVDSAKELNTEYEHSKELLGMIHKSFIDKEGELGYPGNLDVCRNTTMPPEFRKDIAGVSTLNGLYMSYKMMKQMGVTPEEFVNNPKKCLTKESQKYIDKKNINKSIVGKSGADAILEVAKHSNNIVSYQQTMALGRVIESMGKLEQDPEMSKHNAGAEYGYSMTTSALIDSVNDRENIVGATQNQLDRYLLVNEPQQNADLLGIPTFDYDGNKRMKPAEYFDEAKYLMEHKESPEAFVERMNGEIVKLYDGYQGANDLTQLSPEIINGIVSKAATKYAMSLDKNAKNTEAYKKIKDMATNSISYVKKVLTDAVENGEYEQDIDSLSFDFEEPNPHTLREYEDYEKGAAKTAERNAKPIITADERLNAQLTRIDKQIADIRKKGVLNKAESEQVDNLLAQKNGLISERKEALLDAYAQGTIPKEYVDRRSEQLDKGPYKKNVPLFEADKPLTRADFTAKLQAEGKNVNNVNQEYQKYLNSINDRKKMHFMKEFMERENMTIKEKRLNREEREAQRQAQLNAQAPQNNQVENNAPENQQQINVEINENEPIVNNNNPQVDQNVIQEENVINVNQQAEELGERVSIDLDEEPIEINNDMVKQGEEKKLDKGEINK